MRGSKKAAYIFNFEKYIKEYIFESFNDERVRTALGDIMIFKVDVIDRLLVQK